MKKIFSIAVSFFVCILYVRAQNYDPQDVENYIAQYKDLAIEEMHRTGIPASITLGQGIIESGAGKSPLATEANNHFGIKCHDDWNGGTFYWDDDKKDECFRKYENADQSFKDHSDFLKTRDRYACLFKLDATDYQGWAKGLKACGYATNLKYADVLINT
ncbi:MAG: glycoside hydrolase family 73 protein, partial [Chitinophagales bacterium]